MGEGILDFVEEEGAYAQVSWVDRRFDDGAGNFC